MTRDLRGWRRVMRYYQAGLVNAGFGYGLYALLVWLGLGRYGAQALAHVVGTLFNYLTYRTHAFPDASGGWLAKLRFALSYAVNYLMSLAVLAGVSQFWPSPYGAGLATIVIVSALNFLVLRHFVFKVAAG